MPSTTATKQYPFPVVGDPFRPASVDFPALAARAEAIAAREPGVVLSAQKVQDIGISGQIRAGRQRTLADFTTLCALPTSPVGIFNLGDLTNLGTGGALTNKGAVPFGVGINGVAATAAQFAGSTGQALYIVDTGAADPFRIKTGSWGCWFKTAKRGTSVVLMSKWSAAAATRSFTLEITSANVAAASLSDGTNLGTLVGVTDICDDHWHSAEVTVDGTTALLYVDGAIEASAAFAPLNTGATAPFNIGGYLADATTAATAPAFARIDEAFITADIINLDQVRLLYCSKIAHGYAVVPSRTHLAIRRARRGAPLVSGDFPSAPVRLHGFAAGALTDAGSGAVALTANNAPIVVGGVDGTKDGSYNFVAASTQSLSSTDTGLPSGTATRSYGGWFKTTDSSAGTKGIIGWGTISTNDARLVIASGQLFCQSGADSIAGPIVSDGLWHRIDVVEDNGAADGGKRKLYVDTRLVGVSTTLTSLTLAGANRFRIGANPDGTGPMTAQFDDAYVHSIALTQEQIQALYQKGSQQLGASVKEPGAHLEAIDATNVYSIFDSIDPQNFVDLAVAG